MLKDSVVYYELEDIEELMEKVKFLSNNWNSIPSNLELSMEKQDPIIIHLAGMKLDERIKYLNMKLK